MCWQHCLQQKIFLMKNFPQKDYVEFWLKTAETACWDLAIICYWKQNKNQPHYQRRHLRTVPSVINFMSWKYDVWTPNILYIYDTASPNPSFAILKNCHFTKIMTCRLFGKYFDFLTTLSIALTTNWRTFYTLMIPISFADFLVTFQPL